MLRKKLLKAYSTLSLAALSTISFISWGCGQSTSLVSKEIDDSFFYVANPYVSNKQSWNAVNDIIEAYNKHIEAKNKSIKDDEKKWIPAKPAYLGESYGKTHAKVVNFLEINAHEERPSTALGYATTLSFHAKHGKESSIDDPTVLSVIAPAFRKTDAKIEGLSDDKTWVAPFGFSGVITGINAPMLGYVVKSFLKAGAKLSEDAQERQWFEQIMAIAAFDAPKIEEVFGPLTTDAAVLQKIRNYELDRRKWHTAVGFYDFGSLVIEAFPNYQYYVIGIDAPSDHFSTMLFTLLGNDYEKMPFKLVKENNRNVAKVNKLFDPSSEQYKNARKVFDLMKSMMLKRVLWIKTAGQYASSDFKEHKIMFSTGSSAGWEFSYKLTTNLAAKRDGKEYRPKLFLFPSIKSRASILSNLKLENLDLTKGEFLDHGQFGYFVDEGSSQLKKLFMGEGADGLQPPKAAGPEDLIFTPAVTRKIKALFAKEDGSPHNNFVVLDKQDHDYFRGMSGVERNFVYKDGSGKSHSNSAFALANEVVPLGYKDSLQPWELKATFGPQRFDTNTKHHAVYVNGPVLMKFAVSAERDRNVDNFVKFFLTQKVWDRYRKGQLQERHTITPAEYFALQGNYVSVTTDVLLKGDIPESKKDNDYYVYAYQGFRKAAEGKDPNFGLFRSVVASANFYEALATALANVFKNPKYTFEEFLHDIRQVLVSDGIL